jgi:hypothetical protein
MGLFFEVWSDINVLHGRRETEREREGVDEAGIWRVLNIECCWERLVTWVTII